MTENRDFKYIGEKGRKIKNLIKYILCINRQKKQKIQMNHKK